MTLPSSPRSQPLLSRIDNLFTPFHKLIDEWSAFDVAITMTLFLFILHLGGGYLTLPIILLALAAFFFRSWRTNKFFWLVVCVILIGSNLRNWYRIDNHIFLISYWTLAIFTSLFTVKPDKSLAESARWIIGIVFLFATFWKVISGDYINSSFFHYELLLDDRFRVVAVLLGGVTDRLVEFNSQAQDQLMAYNNTLLTVQLQDTVRVAWIAQFLTWWTIIIEGIVALVFLWPKDRFISKWRDATLLIFLASTYSVAPVIGFGWTLTAMGMAQASPNRYIRFLYVGAFLLLKFYHFIMLERPIFG